MRWHGRGSAWAPAVDGRAFAGVRQEETGSREKGGARNHQHSRATVPSATCQTARPAPIRENAAWPRAGSEARGQLGAGVAIVVLTSFFVMEAKVTSNWAQQARLAVAQGGESGV